MQKFKSNGKLLLTGEYVVLDGSLALALPTTKYGQTLKVQRSKFDVQNSHEIHYKAFLNDDSLWLECVLNKSDFSILKSSNHKLSETFQFVLKELRLLNSKLFESNESLEITSKLDFPKDWGLGSSSTFLNNLAQWANINPFELSNNTFGGSGYDIACANHNRPILYQRTNPTNPIVREVNFNPSFKNELYFVYLNQKQNSREGISSYRKKKTNSELIQKVSQITESIIRIQNLEEFEQLLNEHESLISNHLEIPTVKERLFPDYSGTIKSLGAWGGDFILVTARENFKSYFKQKGYSTVLSYNDLFDY